MSKNGKTKKPSKARVTTAWEGLQKDASLRRVAINAWRTGSAYVRPVDRTSYAHDRVGHESCGLPS